MSSAGKGQALLERNSSSPMTESARATWERRRMSHRPWAAQKRSWISIVRTSHQMAHPARPQSHHMILPPA